MKGDVLMPPVASEERLSRYILQKSHVRQNNTLKADPFIPHPYADLSVTRHLDLAEDVLWNIGEEVARQIGKTLYGRAENRAKTYLSQDLSVVAAPVAGNRNHANVTNWPADKPTQKMKALDLAANSVFVPRSA